MNKYIIVLCIILSAGCKSSAIDSKEEKGTIVGKVLTERDEKILSDVTKRFSNISRSALADEPFKSMNEIKSLTVTSIPCYVFDDQKYYENPIPENILGCLSLAENEVWYFCKNKGNIQLVFNAVYSDKIWDLYKFHLDCDKTFGWLPPKFAEIDSTGYGFIKVFNSYYFMYKMNGRLVYNDLTGEEISEEKFCQILLNTINYVRENKERIRQSLEEKL